MKDDFTKKLEWESALKATDNHVISPLKRLMNMSPSPLLMKEIKLPENTRNITDQN